MQQGWHNKTCHLLYWFYATESRYIYSSSQFIILFLNFYDSDISFSVLLFNCAVSLSYMLNYI